MSALTEQEEQKRQQRIEALDALLEEGGGMFVSGEELVSLLEREARSQRIWLKVGLRRECPNGHACATCDEQAKQKKK